MNNCQGQLFVEHKEDEKIKTQESGQKKYNTIDLLKCICAILVVMAHIEPFGKVVSTGIFDFLNYGLQKYLARLAVPYFFVASGFFLFRKYRTRSINDYSVILTYIKKIFRLYVIWTIIYLPLIVRGFFYDEKGMSHAVLIFVRNFIFAGSYPQLWYLPALIVAVILVTISLQKNIKPQNIIIISGGVYIIGLLGQSWFGLIRPIESQLPDIWMLLKQLENVIVTTRNGLFDGFLFVSFGMCFAFFDYKIGKRISTIWFALSMAGMFIESFTLQYFSFIKDYNTYIFLVPAVWFLFYISINTKLPDSPVYKVLRALSSLIIFLHLWVEVVVSKVLRTVSEPLALSWLRFALTLTVTIALSQILIWLSEKKHFKWIKKLYS